MLGAKKRCPCILTCSSKEKPLPTSWRSVGWCELQSPVPIPDGALTSGMNNVFSLSLCQVGVTGVPPLGTGRAEASPRPGLGLLPASSPRTSVATCLLPLLSAPGTPPSVPAVFQSSAHYIHTHPAGSPQPGPPLSPHLKQSLAECAPNPSPHRCRWMAALLSGELG